MVDTIALLGLMAGMTALWGWNWIIFKLIKDHERHIEELRAESKYKKEKEEDRCRSCKEQVACPAFDTGVVYPCLYFKEEKHGAEE